MLTKERWPIDRGAPARLSDHVTHVHVIQVDSERAHKLETALALEHQTCAMLSAAVQASQASMQTTRRLLALQESRSNN